MRLPSGSPVGNLANQRLIDANAQGNAPQRGSRLRKARGKLAASAIGA
jgi:hypothetical protein